MPQTARAAEPSAWVLPGGQERVARKLVGAEAPDLGEGWRVGSLAISRDAVEIRLVGPDARATATLRAPGEQPQTSVTTRVGQLQVPAEVPASVAAALKTRLDRPGPRLAWKRTGVGHTAAVPDVVPAALDEGGARAEAQGLRERVARRLSGAEQASPHMASDHSAPDQTQAARVLAASGDEAAAAATLWRALAQPELDQTVILLARRWGWLDADAAESDHPRRPRSLAPWLWLAGALFAGATAWVAGRERDRLAWAAVAALLVGVIAAIATAPSDVRPLLPSPSQDWLQLGRGGSCVVGAPHIAADLWAAEVTCGGQSAQVDIRGSDRGDATARTERHSLRVVPSGSSVGGAVPYRLAGWFRAVTEQVRALERRSLGLTESPATGPEAVSRAVTLAHRSEREQNVLRLGAVVWAAALLALLALLMLAGRDLWRLAQTHRHGRYWLLSLVTVAVLTHVLAPSRMVMVYSGYPMVESLVGLEPLRYGPAANWVYGVPLWTLGADHGVVQVMNRLYGLATLLFLAALASRLAPRRPRLALLVALATVTAPLLWRDHASESVLVGGMLFLVAALYGLSRADRPTAWLLAVPCGALAALSRPEMALAAPLLALIVLAAVGRAPLRRHWPGALLAGAALAAVAVPHVLSLEATVGTLSDREALPGLARLASSFWSWFWSPDTLTVAADWGPALVLPLVLLGAVFARGQRLLVVGFLAVAVAWMTFTRVDLPLVSIPRVHVPPWLLLTLGGALGADVVLTWLDDRAPRWRHAGYAMLAVAWAVSAAWTVPRLYAPTNADAEEALIREALAALPDEGRVCLATVGYDDVPAPGKTHRSFPQYLLRGRPDGVELSHLGAADRFDSGRCTGGRWALLGMRCYMHLREDAAAGPPPPGDQAITACRDLRRTWLLEPVIERRVPNQGDVAFPMYPDGDALTIGLYRIERRLQGR